MRILRAQDYRRMRWKNGGGETTEIIVSPEGASLDAFEWRVSMAHVASNGPFSLFPGIDRTLAVLEGNGIKLRVDGRELDLTMASKPFAFPADSSSGADLIDGPIVDLNVMSRRGVMRHSLTRLAASEPYTIRPNGDAALVLLRDGDAEVDGQTLKNGDSVLLENNDGEALFSPLAAVTLYICKFSRI